MSARLRPLNVEPPVPKVAFRRWGKAPEPVLLPLSERMPTRVPPGSTTLSDDGSTFHTTTPLGTVVAWDICGRCSVHVKTCKCASPTPTRSVTYIWFQDAAAQRGEDWSPEHPDYRREFPTYRPPTTTPRRARKRLRRRAR